MKSRQTLRSFYCNNRFNRKRRTLELCSNKTKDRLASKERRFLLPADQRADSLVMAIGDRGTGVGSTIKGYNRRGGTWLLKRHERYCTTVLTSEFMTSQLCIYCYSRLSHPVLGTSRCLNPNCVALKCGRAYHNRDVMPAVAIGLSAMANLILKKDLPPFTQKINRL